MTKRNEKRARLTAAALVLALAGWAALHAQTQGGFKFQGLVGRVITPNGDGRNDVAIFCVDNPSSSGVSGTIYSMLGRRVASMTGPIGSGGYACPAPSLGFGGQVLTWDGTNAGSAVHSGIYVYEIKAEGTAYTGTLVVVR